MTHKGPFFRAVLVAAVMTVVLGAVLGLRTIRLHTGSEITLATHSMTLNDPDIGDVEIAFEVALRQVEMVIHPDAPARSALKAGQDRVTFDGWVSLKTGPSGKLEVMRISASRLGPRTGEVVLQVQSFRVSSFLGEEPEMWLTLATLQAVVPDDRAKALYQPGVPLTLVLSVTQDGRALFRRVTQGDVVLVEAPGLL